MEFCQNNNKKGMTMIEILMVLVIISMLFATFFYIWNTMDIFRKSRDSKRINDLYAIDTALKTILATESNINLGQENVIYTSLPDSSSTCGSYNLVPVFSPFSYHCQPPADYLKVDGNGWIPVNFTLGKILTIAVLPTDPLNNKDYFYAYQVKQGRYKLTARFESKTNVLKMTNDGGFEPTLYEVGSNLFIHSPHSGLVGYWSFDEATGTIAYDKSGYGNNGTLYNFNWTATSGWATGKVGGALSFDGVNDYVSIANTSSLQIVGNLTLLFWAYPTNISKSRQNPVGKAFGGEFDLTMETDSGLSYYHGSAGGNSSPYMGCFSGGVFSNNNWVFVAVVRDINTKTIKYYKNGDVSPSNCGSWVNPSISTRRVGIGYEYAGYWQGLIDEIRIYNRALSDSEIKALYQATK